MITTLVITALTAYGLYVVGSDAGVGGFAFVVVTSLISFSGAFFVGDRLRRTIPESFFHVSDRVNGVARALGVDAFSRFLSLVQWNRVLLSMRPSLTERRPPDELFAGVRSSGVGHAWGAAVHLVAALIAAMASLSAPLWILGLGLLLHVYPALLQCRVHWRVQRLREITRD